VIYDSVRINDACTTQHHANTKVKIYSHLFHSNGIVFEKDDLRLQNFNDILEDMENNKNNIYKNKLLKVKNILHLVSYLTTVYAYTIVRSMNK
jgi:hypothetical protein